MPNKHVQALEPLLRNLSDQIWQFAEIGLREYKSASLLADACRDEGFQVEEGIAGMPTAFVARWGDGTPAVGYLAEYDALPGLSQKMSLVQEPVEEGGAGHGCGHNLLGVAALGAAFALKRSIAEEGKEGTVYLFGCPAEETITAKGYMVRDGYFDHVDAVIDWHPADLNMVNVRKSLACDSIIFNFHGRAAHAAGNPEWGRSALKAVELMNAGVNCMREHIIDDARIHYVITDGGHEPNVVPAYAAVWYYTRAPRRSQTDDITRRVILCAEGAALMTETELEVKVIDKCYNMLPNRVLSQITQEEFLKVGAPQIPPGHEKYIEGLRAVLSNDQIETVLEEYHMPLDYDQLMHTEVLDLETGVQVAPGSTDAGDVSWKAPLAQINVACMPVGTPGHSWMAVSAFRSELGIQGMLTAATVLSQTGWRLVNEPALVAAAKAELEASLRIEPFKVTLTPDLKPPIPE